MSESNEALITEMQTVLAHLDDPLYLEKHALAQRIWLDSEPGAMSRGQALRRAVRLAIAELDPSTAADGERLRARSYQVLYRYAVARQGMPAIAPSLGISERQAYRDLRSAAEALVNMLSRFFHESAVDGGGAGTSFSLAEQVRDELQRLSRYGVQQVDVGQMLEEVVQSVQVLAYAGPVKLVVAEKAKSLMVVASRVMLRQAFINLLSHMVSVETHHPVVVRLERNGTQACVQFRYYPPRSLVGPRPTDPYAMAIQILDSLGISWEQIKDGSCTTISLSISLVRERTVLIVDDNEGVIALFRRYLQHQPYRVHGAQNATRALDIVDQLEPDVVILDVMMPDRDGWEALRALRLTGAGRRARVIVCTIINDPRLATALGADAFLHKPVDRLRLNQALQDVLSSAR